jgi:hypothetical protein
MSQRRSRVNTALLLAGVASILVNPVHADAGVTLTASTGPLVTVGFEGESMGIGIGGDFFWAKNRSQSDYVSGPLSTPYSSYIDTRALVVVPSISLSIFARRAEYSRYALLRVARRVPVYASADADEDAEARKDELKDRYDDYSIDGGIGIRLPLRDRWAIGGELGCRFFVSDTHFEGALHQTTYSYRDVNPYFMVTLTLR